MSLLVHLIVVPTDTLMGFGTYALVVRNEAPIGIVTIDGEVPLGEGMVGVGTVPGVVEVPPPQPANAATHVRKPARRIRFISLVRLAKAFTLG